MPHLKWMAVDSTPHLIFFKKSNQILKNPLNKEKRGGDQSVTGEPRQK